MVFAMLALASPVAADCATDGWGTPDLRHARDIVFSGVIEEPTSVPSDGGPPTEWSGYRMGVGEG